MMKSFKDMNENVSWKDITPGGEIYEGGTSKYFRTGDWRIDTPIFIAEKCKQCLLCAPVCPDSSIPVVDGKRGEFDYDHCKGCGICAKVCPFGAIEMKKEEN
ncbi:MAG: 4Fe-4S binding protein [Clostridiales bacterium]|nr:4Fe-4S binding protein [Clostridiales bacterium]